FKDQFIQSRDRTYIIPNPESLGYKQVLEIEAILHRKEVIQPHLPYKTRERIHRGMLIRDY
ncbi:hypothetical protein BGX30_008045, partial [Mortierella sp. GBA39]